MVPLESKQMPVIFGDEIVRTGLGGKGKKLSVADIPRDTGRDLNLTGVDKRVNENAVQEPQKLVVRPVESGTDGREQENVEQLVTRSGRKEQVVFAVIVRVEDAG